jgi:hypothetical protein
LHEEIPIPLRVIFAPKFVKVAPEEISSREKVGLEPDVVVSDPYTPTLAKLTPIEILNVAA